MVCQGSPLSFSLLSLSIPLFGVLTRSVQLDGIFSLPSAISVFSMCWHDSYSILSLCKSHLLYSSLSLPLFATSVCWHDQSRSKESLRVCVWLLVSVLRGLESSSFFNVFSVLAASKPLYSVYWGWCVGGVVWQQSVFSTQVLETAEYIPISLSLSKKIIRCNIQLSLSVYRLLATLFT